MQRSGFALRVVLPLLFVSCTTTVKPPLSVADPQTVILLTHGKSSSLVLPGGDARMVRWAFGDWRYYALGRTGPFETIAAALWPTRAALGRQVVEPASNGTEELLASLGIGIDEAFPIRVERSAVEKLQTDLQAIFAENVATLRHNPAPRLDFVHHPEPYTLVNSSNRKVAEWLRELGCTITGIALLSNWSVEAATSQIPAGVKPRTTIRPRERAADPMSR